MDDRRIAAAARALVASEPKPSTCTRDAKISGPGHSHADGGKSYVVAMRAARVADLSEELSRLRVSAAACIRETAHRLLRWADDCQELGEATERLLRPALLREAERIEGEASRIFIGPPAENG